MLGTNGTEGAERAERNGDGPGRQCTFRYEAFDRAGNRSERGITIVVPHDMDCPALRALRWGLGTVTPPGPLGDRR